MKKILSNILSILFISISLISSIIFYTNNINFYKDMHLKNDISNKLDISYNDLIDVNINLLDYLNNKRDNLDMSYIIDNTNIEFFNNKEKLHMIDVKNIYNIFLTINYILIILFIIILIYLIFNKDYYLIFNSYNNILIKFIIILIILILLILIDFQSIWVLLHKLFFTNDLWLLNPYTDRMIMMYPLNFFYNIVIRILLMFIIINISMLKLSRRYIKIYLKERV